jgi:hypothetical protein
MIYSSLGFSFHTKEDKMLRKKIKNPKFQNQIDFCFLEHCVFNSEIK